MPGSRKDDKNLKRASTRLRPIFKKYIYNKNLKTELLVLNLGRHFKMEKVNQDLSAY